MVGEHPSASLVLDLIEAVNQIATGTTVQVAVEDAQQVEQVHAWCRATGNSVFAVHEQSVEVYRGAITDYGDLPAEQVPGHRLWIYTNFHCNLACDYCCVSSSPQADPVLLSANEVRDLVKMGTSDSVKEIYLTGGEPFMNPEIVEITRECVAAAPTVMLTNAMLLRGQRLEWLRAMPREGLTLQVSVDSPDPGLHDLHRGAGSWQRAIDGVKTAKQEGHHVRLAATLASDATEQLDELCTQLELSAAELIVRRVAKQGVATDGVAISRATVVPEVCVTGDGIYWHPVAARDPAMRVSDEPMALQEATEQIRSEFLAYRRKGEVLAASFPCA